MDGEGRTHSSEEPRARRGAQALNAESALDWRTALAAAVVAGAVDVAGVARFGRVSRSEAARVLAAAELAGVLSDDGSIVDGALDGQLSPVQVATIHADRALDLLRSDPESYRSAIDHARSATLVDQSELLQLVQASGRLALAAGDFERAAELLCALMELDPPVDPQRRSALMYELARAEAGRGRGEESDRLLGEVIRLESADGRDGLAVDAAIRLAWPPDWRAGERQVASLLDLADELHGGGPRRAALLAARAVIQMRLPASPTGLPQVAWVTRAEVAQPLAQRALSMTKGREDFDRLFALVAWRSTNRRPDVLERRIEVSREGVALAQSLLEHQFLVDAAVGLAVDQIESGDRSGYDRAIAMVNWAASTEGDPRLQWWAATMRSGAALLDGDLDAANRHRRVAFDLGGRHGLPGWVAAEMLLAAEIAFIEIDREEMRRYLVPADEPILSSPIARSSVALMASLLEEHELARSHAEIVLRSVDPESSLLLCCTLLARTALALDDDDLAARCEQLLAPWSGRFAVDANGWWCIGPVDLTLAELAAAIGTPDRAARHLDAADAAIAAMNDTRSVTRATELRQRLEARSQASRQRRPVGMLASLSDRERDVLSLIARGRTNAEIGAELAFSASTIRADTVSIYRKLGVNGRPEAAAVAVTAGLV